MFSRIIPLEEEPSQHALWVMAQRFGATCTAHMGPDVTHLITNTQHTLKVASGLAFCPGLLLVTSPK